MKSTSKTYKVWTEKTHLKVKKYKRVCACVRACGRRFQLLIFRALPLIVWSLKVFIRNPIELLKSAFVIEASREKRNQWFRPLCYRSLIPSQLDVIFLLPSPSVNTLQVSHISRRCVKGARTEREIEETEATKSHEAEDAAPTRAHFEFLSRITSVFPRVSDLSIIRLVFAFGWERARRTSPRDRKLISLERTLTRKGTPERQRRRYEKWWRY